MESKNYLIFFIAMLMAVPVYGQVGDPTVSDNLDEYGPFDGTSNPGSAQINGSEVRQVNISSNLPTDTWAGFYGEVTGQITVGSTDSIYTWDSAVGRYVYATDQSIDFTSDWISADTNDMTSEYPFVDIAGTNPSETFNYTTDVGSITQENDVKDTIAAHTLDSNGDPKWETAFISDGSDYFFASEVLSQNPPSFFDGSQPSDAGFQMILPEDKSSGSITEYTVFVELE